ncbi:MAG: DUF3326 domain-containing protein [Bdellovibrionales bacterium]|nr:DUF3326 domain-containing protein [Bdellovibrionales bacterium]
MQKRSNLVLDDIFQLRVVVPKFKSTDLTTYIEQFIQDKLGSNYFPLRYFIGAVTERDLVVDAVVANQRFQTQMAPSTIRPQKLLRQRVVVNLIPTGIQATFGGWAGDATPITKLLSKSAPLLVTNPNALNASNFIDIPENVIYAEGSQIDSFMRGLIGLDHEEVGRVGVILEKTNPKNRALVMNLISTAKYMGGVDIIGVIETTSTIGSKVEQTPDGAYVGKIERPDVLLKAARKLLEKGATAIAVTSKISGYNEMLYTEHFAGSHPNPIGGVETIISHLLVTSLGVPAAHGPLVNYKPHQSDTIVVDPRGGGEFVSACGLYCVLRGLSQAPQMSSTAGLTVEDVLAVVTPADTLGGIPVLEAIRRNVPVIAVRDNKTILDVTAEQLGLNSVIVVNTYAQASGAVVMLNEQKFSADEVLHLTSSNEGLAQMQGLGEVRARQARVSLESICRPTKTCTELLNF